MKKKNSLPMLTPEIERRIRNPKPGGKVEAAIKAGVDIEELIENLKLTPEQRIEKMMQKLEELERIDKQE